MATPMPGAIVGPSGRPFVPFVAPVVSAVVAPVITPIDLPVTAKEAVCVEQ
jgi:hypothetical protein